MESAQPELWLENASRSDDIPDNVTTNGTVGKSKGGNFLSFAVVMPFLWLFMFFSNLAVLLVYKRYLGFQSLTNYFVYNIAVADLCMSFNMLVQMMFFLGRSLSSSEHLCLFRMELMAFFTTVSMLSGLFATVDRFMIIVVHRHYHAVMSIRNVKLLIAVAWIYSLFFAAIPFFSNNWDLVQRCEFVTVMPAWYIVYGSSQTIVNTLVEILLYLAIFHVAGRRRRQFKNTWSRSSGATARQTDSNHGIGAPPCQAGGNHGNGAAPKEQQSLRGAKFMGVVLITYSLCWMPFAVLGYIQIYMYHPSLTLVRMVTVFLGISNSLLNPLLYAWQKKEFRNALTRLLRLPHKQVHVHSDTPAAQTGARAP